MIAIETRYLGPTNTKPSRIVAETCNGQRLIMSVSAAEDGTDGSVESASRHVAQSLADSMGWGKLGDCGATKSGYVFCFPNK